MEDDHCGKLIPGPWYLFPCLRHRTLVCRSLAGFRIVTIVATMRIQYVLTVGRNGLLLMHVIAAHEIAQPRDTGTDSY